MSKTAAILCITLLQLVGSGTGYAEAEQKQVSSFAQLQQIIEKIDDPMATLLVMDDDDTLTMMSCPKGAAVEKCQYLGGPAWYAWQSKLAGTGSPYSVAATQGELLDIAALLLSINDMDYTEADVPLVLNKLAGSGVRLLVETARGSSNISATEMQFKKRQVGNSSYGSFLDLIATNALLFGQDNRASVASPYAACNAQGLRPLSYRNGVMYVAGQNKGEMLQCMLKRYEINNGKRSTAAIRHIVFIDDTQENVDDVYRAFKSSNYHVKALHYDALDKHKEALTKGADHVAYQQQANGRWSAIKEMLQTELLKPALAD